MQHSTPYPLRLVSIVALFLAFHCGHAAVYAKDTWTSVRSKNFHLVGNASEKQIKQVAIRMEQFREVFSRLFPTLSLASPVPTTVIVFKSDSSYKPYKPVTEGKTVAVAGYFQSGRDMNYITLTVESSSGETYRTIFHEYVHLLVNNTLGRAGVPPWFNEGLAEYYSTFEIEEGRKAALGKLIDNHLYLLRSSKLTPLQSLFSLDYYSLERNKHDARGHFYAQSWLVVHYLIQANEGQRVSHLGRFLALLMTNTPVEEAFQQAFQMDFATLEAELKRYLQQRTYRMSVATFEKKLEFETEMQSSPMTEAEGLAYLGDLLYHTQRHDEAVRKLGEALALNPNLSMANASLGMALMEQRKFTEAKQHLVKAVQEDGKNYLAHYYYAYVLSREGMDSTGLVNGYPEPTAKLMRDALNKAIALRPDFAENYHLLAFVNLVMGEQLDESLSLIRQAMERSPGNETYHFIAIQIFLRKQDFASAKRIAEPLASSSSDPRIRSQAAEYMRTIQSVQEQMAAFEKKNALLTSSDRDTTVLVSSDTVQDVKTDPHSYLEEALRKPKEGEKRLQGNLIRLDCSAKGITYTVKSGTTTRRLFSKNFETISITTFTTDVTGELTCGVRKTEEAVVITYKPQPDKRAKTDGVLVALEFVPKDFKLKD